MELAEIENQLFETKCEKLAKSGQKPKKSTIEQLNKHCVSSIDLFEQVIQSVVNSGNKEALENLETLQTIITAKFNVAKNYSRLQPKDTAEKINALKRSLDAYKWIKDFINQYVSPQGALSYEMRETLKNCEEMCSLIPAKIDRVHYEGLQK